MYNILYIIQCLIVRSNFGISYSSFAFFEIVFHFLQANHKNQELFGAKVYLYSQET